MLQMLIFLGTDALKTTAILRGNCCCMQENLSVPRLHTEGV